MRRYAVIMLLPILVQACSAIPFLGAASEPTLTSGPSATASKTATATVTPTASITPSITPSATIVHFPTQDPDLPTETFVPIPIFIGINTATPVLPATPARPGPGFTSVTVSDPRIFWGACIPNKTRITAKVEDTEAVTSVVVFVQVKALKREDYTPWSNGDVMYNYRNGTFTVSLKAGEVYGHNHYKDSWLRYQLVATDKDGIEIGRTQIYTQSIQMAPCMCYEPLKGCPLETPRPTATPRR